MANMSYCRFQNTLLDLQACHASMAEDEPLSREELIARNHLVMLCQEIADTMDSEGRCVDDPADERDNEDD